jgi:hypothetical protein
MAEAIGKDLFEQFKGDVERRLDGHDGLYRDLRETREELVRFTEALKSARDEIVSGMTDRDKCQEACAGYRAGFEKRIRALEKFRWQIGGALVVVAAVPGWTAVILLLKGG